MHRNPSLARDFASVLSFWLLVALLVALWFAGGSSRADVLAQAVIRFSAWAILIVFILLAPRFEWRRVRAVAILLGLCILLVAAQLVPLPPGVWTELPTRELLAQASEIGGFPQQWRPLSVSPSATTNAIGSLVVPVAVLVLAANLSREQHWHLITVILVLVLAGCLIALIQISRSSFGNPLINFVPGAVSGNFANRNHFALFVAIGLLVAPAWGFRRDRGGRWKAIAAIAMLPFLLLISLSTGSRAGLLLGAVSLIAGLWIVRGEIRREVRSLSRIGGILVVVGSVTALATAIGLSVALGRAVSVDRALDLQAVDDLRARALPYVLDAVVLYFPAGAGFGTFDPVYRMLEPDALLQPAYFNHAHNDWLEIALEGGVPAVALALGALVWWAAQSMNAWRRTSSEPMLAQTASCAMLLVFLGSITDYPARTPMIMAIVVLVAVWLTPMRPSSDTRDEAS